MDSIRLIGAVEKALGRVFDPYSLEDLFIMQRGCYILNNWGVEPIHRYDRYFGGPFSEDLGVEYRDLQDEGVRFTTDVDEGTLIRLRELFDRGTDFVHAYSTLLTIREVCPNSKIDDVVRHAHRMEPELGDNIEGASALLTR
ncbi:MAG: hypothetical protein IJ469_03970 [Candidatus Methanomethylophilaceae archaeon]|nr:hypothetical protein [Candidatus Methanomethylophilaceae archaeon]